MQGRFILVSFALIAIAFLAVPTDIAISTGAIKTSTDNVRCDACHPATQEEFSRSAVHKTLSCSSCHYISEFGTDLYSHNATTLECIYCHTETENRFNKDAHPDGEKMCNDCHSHVREEIEKHPYNEMNMVVSVIGGGLKINISSMI